MLRLVELPATHFGSLTRARIGTSVLVAAGIAGGIGLRIWVLTSSVLGPLDSDEAVSGLMARHVLHGELRVFFWGQSYGGAQETFLTAGVFALFGSSTAALRVVPLTLYALAALLVWRIGRRTVGESAARIGALLFWLWPSYFVWRSVKAYGYYGAAPVLGLGVVLFALRLRERDSRLDFLLLGLVLGLGWWATPQTALLAVPVLAWLFWRRPGALRGAWLVVPAVGVGAMPLLIESVKHGLYSPGVVNGRTFLSHLRGFFGSTLPTALGLRVPFSLSWLL